MTASCVASSAWATVEAKCCSCAALVGDSYSTVLKCDVSRKGGKESSTFLTYISKSIHRERRSESENTHDLELRTHGSRGSEHHTSLVQERVWRESERGETHTL